MMITTMMSIFTTHQITRIIIIIQLWSQYWPATNPASIWYAELQARSSIRLFTLHIFFGIGIYIQLLNIVTINIINTIFSLDLESTSKTSSSTVSPLECTEADWLYRQNATSVKYFKRRKLQKGTIYQFFILYIIISFPDFKWSALVLVAVIMMMIILMMMLEATQGGWVLAEMRSAVCEIFKRRDIAKPTRDPLIRK